MCFKKYNKQSKKNLVAGVTFFHCPIYCFSGFSETTV